MSPGKYFVHEQKDIRPSPEHTTNFISRILFWWALPLLSAGYRKLIEESDLYEIPDELQVKSVEHLIHVADWSKKWALCRAILTGFLREYWWIPVFEFLVVVLVCINPFLVLALVSAVKAGSISISGHPVFTNVWQAVFALLISTSTIAVVRHNVYWASMKGGLRFRAATMSLLYRKALKLRIAGRKSGFTSGVVTNMFAVDADTILSFIWGPSTGLFFMAIQVIILLVLVCLQVGYVGLFGFLTMIAVTAVQGPLLKKANTYRELFREKSDERAKLLGEVLQGIRAVKLNGWEESFLTRIQQIRKAELDKLLETRQYQMWSIMLGMMVASLTLCVTFTAYVLTGHTLTVEVAFTVLALFNAMSDPLRVGPWFIGELSSFLVSMKSVQKFLREGEEVDPQCVGTSASGEVSAVNATVLWESKTEGQKQVNDQTHETESLVQAANQDAIIEMSDSSDTFVASKPALTNITFKAETGKLTCIVGPVGCGKTALLQAILGELDLESGSISAPSSIALTPQTPWILSSTILENILFGRAMDPTRYNRVLIACALVRDLALLPAGDMTEIGEKGVNLSGGQQHRVSLARALYFNPQCYLLDEPLSAVDSHVAKHLFEECIQGMMADCTRVLVTHQIQFLPHADMIYVLSDGQITHRGTYYQLVKQGVDFDTILHKRFEEEEKEAGNKASSQPEKADEPQSAEGNAADLATVQKNQTEDKAQLVAAEERQVGAVQLSIYKKYFGASGAYGLFLASVGLIFLSMVCYTGADYWLTFWAGNTLGMSNKIYVLVYLGFLVMYGLISRLVLHLMTTNTLKSGAALHERLLRSIFGAKASFFDTTPTGRIMNRFTKDQFSLDLDLTGLIHETLECFIGILVVILSVCILTPIFILPIALLGSLYYGIQHYYRFTCRELKRISSISYSAIFSWATETMNGVGVIRAFKHQKQFIDVFYKSIDANTTFTYNEFIVNRWLSVHLELVSALVVFSAACVSIFSIRSINPGVVGFIVTATLALSNLMAWTVRQFTDLEIKMNAVERILHYCENVPQERTSPRIAVADSWPEHGAIEIHNLVVRYREGLDPVLNGVDCMIKPGEKIGVVGRTGAGKSTLTSALFRMIEASSGSIIIDGIDIAQIDLAILRSRLSIIPQDPVLFSGSIKMNLDPFAKHSDVEIWDVLTKVHLAQHVQGLPEQLNFCITENGGGFSVGQKQLLCLGRALLRNSRILVMDEATASLDFNTDALIKTTVRECFASNTLIIIAHRLDTILDSDRVMVFERGQIVEMDSPSTLRNNPHTKFASLVTAANNLNK